MAAISLDLKPITVNQQAQSLDVSVSNGPQLDWSLLVMPPAADLAQTTASQVDVTPFTELNPLRAIANEFLATQNVADVVTDRIAEALEIIVGMERNNALRDTELSWQEMYNLTSVPNSLAVAPDTESESEYANQLLASLAA